MALLSSPAVHAQSTIKDAVFSAIEKRIVRDHFGVPATATNEDQTAPDWAVKEDDDDDAQDDRDEPKKAKKDKGNKGQGNKDKGNKDKGKNKSKGMPPGRAKRDQLPPGLAKQLAEKGRLPPGLAKRDLPTDLAAQLPTRPADQEVKVVEGDVVLLDRTTGIILDVIKDVVRNGTAAPQPDGTLAPPSQQQPATQDSVIDSVLKTIFGNGK